MRLANSIDTCPTQIPLKVIVSGKSVEMPEIGVMHITRVNSMMYISLGYSSTLETAKGNPLTVCAE